MKKSLFFPVVLLSAALVATPSHAGSNGDTVLRFGTMFGVDGIFVGAAHPIRGIPGDGLPWEIESVRGSLTADGHLRVHVRGVVFKDDPSVPPDLRGINDEPTFRAVVSCESSDELGNLVAVNLTTDPSAATKSGDSDFDSILTLPDPCVAPIVLIISGDEDDWFAVTGLESED